MDKYPGERWMREREERDSKAADKKGAVASKMTAFEKKKAARVAAYKAGKPTNIGTGTRGTGSSHDAGRVRHEILKNKVLSRMNPKHKPD